MGDGATNPRHPQTAGDWPADQARFLNRAALICAPQEACGLILGKVGKGVFQIESLTHCENQATETRTHFRVSAEHLMHWDSQAQRMGLHIVGAWHSHPRGPAAPSQADLDGLPADWIGLIVVPGQEGSPLLQTYGRAGSAPAFVHV